MTGIEIIAAERLRQIEEEGYAVEHDDAHRSDELARAAAIYAMPDALRVYIGPNRGKSAGDNPPFGWPWAWEHWKPSCHRIRELAKAGALIAAEIDRLQREGASDD